MSPSYVANIYENALKNTPVTIFGQKKIPEVFDYDLGTDGTEGNNNKFNH